MDNPFQFLNSFGKKDADKFFGRTKEKSELKRLVRSNSLVLVHGNSGTGKTSLIKCGLESEFQGPDWLPVHIRRSDNLNLSLLFQLNKKISEVESGDNGEIAIDFQSLKSDDEKIKQTLEKINILYQTYQRPVYLIFDQFEELFVLGDEAEQKTFFKTLRSIIDKGLACKIILTTREEFFVNLHDFDEVVPELFQCRFRVKPMNEKGIKEVIDNSFHRFNMQTPPDENRGEVINNIVEVFTGYKISAQLAYLQVYLHELYNRCYIKSNVQPDAQELPIVKVSSVDIEKMGDLKKVLTDYIQRETIELQNELKDNKEYGKDVPTLFTNVVLQAFVSDERTKIPYTFEAYEPQNIKLADGFYKKIPATFLHLPQNALYDCLKGLEDRRIIKSTGNILELTHDSLAMSLAEEESLEIRRLTTISQYISDAREKKYYLSEEKIDEYKKDLTALKERGFLDPEDEEFWHLSIAHNEEKRRKSKAQKLLLIAFLVTSFGLLIVFFVLQREKKYTVQIEKDGVEILSAAHVIRNFFIQGKESEAQVFALQGRFEEGAAKLDTGHILIKKRINELENEKTTNSSAIKRDSNKLNILIYQLKEYDTKLLSKRKVYGDLGEEVFKADSLLKIKGPRHIVDPLLIKALGHYDTAIKLAGKEDMLPSEREYLQKEREDILLLLDERKMDWNTWNKGYESYSSQLKSKESWHDEAKAILTKLAEYKN